MLLLLPPPSWVNKGGGRGQRQGQSRGRQWTMTSIAPAKTAKTAAGATMHGGAYTTLVELLVQEVINAADLSPKCTSNVLLALGALQLLLLLWR